MPHDIIITILYLPRIYQRKVPTVWYNIEQKR